MTELIVNFCLNLTEKSNPPYFFCQVTGCRVAPPTPLGPLAAVHLTATVETILGSDSQYYRFASHLETPQLINPKGWLTLNPPDEEKGIFRTLGEILSLLCNGPKKFSVVHLNFIEICAI